MGSEQTNETPRYPHNCPNCIFLRGLTLPYAQDSVGYRDLYYCKGMHKNATRPESNPYLVQRTESNTFFDSFGLISYFITIHRGNAAYQDWEQGYAEAARRACQRGLIGKDTAVRVVSSIERGSVSLSSGE